jgi:HTH-type transcriptional regulator / antitoxin HipB
MSTIIDSAGTDIRLATLMQIHTTRELGELVRTRRHGLGLTQSALAARIGSTRQWVIALETGRPRLELGLTLRALASLGVTLDLRVNDPSDAQAAGPTRVLPATAPAVSSPPRPSLDAILAGARELRRGSRRKGAPRAAS